MKFSVVKQVRFHHCDPAGIVFYPQFFYLLHEVQEDFLSHIGFDQHRLIASGIGVPIVDLKTEFKGMCRYGDPLIISKTLSKIGSASITANYEIWDDANHTLKLTATTVVVYSDLAKAKSLRIPDDLRAALSPFLAPVKDPTQDES
jgi:4-hydroxybenzoyl-CoA thioesterase